MDSIFPSKPADISPVPPEVCQIDETHYPRTQWLRVTEDLDNLVFSSAIAPLVVEGESDSD